MVVIGKMPCIWQTKTTLDCPIFDYIDQQGNHCLFLHQILEIQSQEDSIQQTYCIKSFIQGWLTLL